MNKPTLTKRCAYCGQDKPLSSFTELKGSGGSILHGNICAECRKSGLDRLNKQNERDEKTSSTTGHKIDAKAKVQNAVDKRQLHQEFKEEEKTEKEKKEEIKLSFIEKRQLIAKKEKKHREDLQKRSLFSKQSAEKTEVTSTHEDKMEAEQKIDFSAGRFDDMAIPKAKYQSSVFQQIKRLLGNSAPISRSVDGVLQQKKDKNAPQETPVDVARKTWGPTKR